MDSLSTDSRGVGPSENVAPYALNVGTVGLTVEVGGVPVSGDIADKLDEDTCRFIFAYGELPVRGEVRPCGDNVELQLVIEVGHIPYTIESRVKRERLIEAVKSFNGNCPDGVGVERNQSISVRGITSLGTPITATRLISAITAMLWDFKPVLQSLDSHLPGLAQAFPHADSPRSAKA